MATDLVEIDPENPSRKPLERAAAAVRRGRVVAIPTDALYTLVADPFNLRAVTQVFARQRPRAASLAAHSGARHPDGRGTGRRTEQPLLLLARRFWPGPLTIIVPASAKVPLKVTGNTGRLALRQSRSKIADGTALLTAQPAADLAPAPTSRAIPPAAAASTSSA